MGAGGPNRIIGSELLPRLCGPHEIGHWAPPGPRASVWLEVAPPTCGLLTVLSAPAEAAEQLGTNGRLAERLVEWCEAKDHAGVMGESNRLLSALIRHSKSKVSALTATPTLTQG